MQKGKGNHVFYFSKPVSKNIISSRFGGFSPFISIAQNSELKWKQTTRCPLHFNSQLFCLFLATCIREMRDSPYLLNITKDIAKLFPQT